MQKKRKKKNNCNSAENLMTEEQYEEYLKALFGMDFIAGYTESGMPYGTFIHENKKGDKLISQDSSFDSNDEMPFKIQEGAS